METSIDTSQLKILEDFFDTLSTEDQGKIWMTAYRKAAKPLVAQARENAPEGQSSMRGRKPHAGGTLKRSMGTVENPSNVSILIGSLFGKKAWYANFIENGTKKRETQGSRFKYTGMSRSKYKNGKLNLQFFASKYEKGVNRGAVKATNFFERAWESTEEQVYGAIQGEWENALQLRIDRVNRILKGGL